MLTAAREEMLSEADLDLHEDSLGELFTLDGPVLYSLSVFWMSR
jgi:hypothetical protein